VLRKIAPLSAVLALALGVTACGGVTSNSQASVASGGKAPPGITKDTIKIGATLPLSGSAAVAGQGLAAGLKIAAKEINQDGGIDGRKIKLTLLDDQFKPSRIVTNVRRLVSQDHVYALVAPAGSKGLPGAWSFIKQSNTPVWGPVSPPDPDLKPVYILSATRTLQDRVIIDHYAKQGAKRLAFIGVDNDLGKAGQKALDTQVPKHPGMKVVANERTQPGSSNVTAAVNNVIASKPDALLLAVNNSQVALILKQLHSQGVHIPVAAAQGGGGAGSPNAVGPAGKAAADGFISAFQVKVVPKKSPATKTWRRLAQQYNGKQGLSGFSLQTYTYLESFAKVLKRMGNNLSQNNFEKVANNLVNKPIKVNGLPPLKCGPLPDGHTCVDQAGLAQYKNGQWTLLENFTAPK
jgi:branched-chain amino acid transport system substrate-binding protein